MRTRDGRRLARRRRSAEQLVLWLVLGGVMAGDARGEDARSGAPEPVASQPARSRIEEVIVTGERLDRTIVSPRAYVSAADAEAINVATVEDFVAYEPSLIVRRRFIGDPNGTLGIRGSSQFQTARSSVYADGLPLHYALQTRFAGAPRWSLVSPEEVLGVEVLYGPFSAEYGGGSMGGVVNIETTLPEKRAFHLEVAGFSQGYAILGTDDRFNGGRIQGSYGDRFGNLSVYLLHSRLANDSQPLTFMFARPVATLAPDAPAPIEIAGGHVEPDTAGNEVLYFGDTGSEASTTALTKLKLGYEQGDWLARLTVAYEDRTREVDAPQSFVREAATGEAFFGGATPVTLNGQAFSLAPSAFEVSEQDRRTLLIGGALDGPLGAGFGLELDFSVFDILEDESRSANFDGGNRRRDDFDDTGWVTADAKLRTDSLAGSDVDLVFGYHYERYDLARRSFTFDGATGARLADIGNASGGTTHTQAAFAQLGVDVTERIDVQLGARYESWHAEDGFFGTARQRSRSESGVSPKLSVGYAPADRWQLRYSIGRAYRFPIAEELFQNERTTRGTSLANADLAPEAGLHHNIMIQRDLDNGFVRMNVFRETVEDVIFNQRVILPEGRGISTFLPIDEEVVNGVELVGNFRGLIQGRVDVRANVSYTDAEISENDAAPETEGKAFPRLPEWRGNLLVTYHFNDRVGATVGVRYASKSFDTLDNSDRERNVFGAQDAYLFTNVKLTYQLTETAKVAFGVDNLTDEEAYVFHPWPARSMYVELSTSF
jgi:iron complex outermembrane receptor protein